MKWNKSAALATILTLSVLSSVSAQTLFWFNDALQEGPNDDDIGIDTTELLPGTPDSFFVGSLVHLILDGGDGIASPPIGFGTGVSGDDSFLAASYVGEGSIFGADGQISSSSSMGLLGLTPADKIYVRVYDRPTPTSPNEVPPMQVYSDPQILLNYPAVTGVSALFYINGPVRQISELPVLGGPAYFFPSSTYDGISVWSFIAGLPTAPDILSPIIISGGDQDLYAVPIGSGSLPLSGSKKEDELVVREDPQGVFSTAGIAQVLSGTNWSYSAAYSLTAQEDQTTVVFRSSTSDLGQNSPEGTTLLIANYGYGTPLVTITSTVAGPTNRVSLSGAVDFDEADGIHISNRLTGFSTIIGSPSYPETHWEYQGLQIGLGTNIIDVTVSNLLGSTSMAMTTAVFAPIPNTIPPPLISSPVNIAPGGTNRHALPAASGIINVSGTRNADTWIMFREGTSEFTTTDVVQVQGNPAWSVDIPYDLSSPESEIDLDFIGILTNFIYIGQDNTRLILENYGYSAPSITITSHMATASNLINMAGFVDRDTFGSILISNSHNGYSSIIAAPVFPNDEWSFAGLPLTAGTNDIIVTVTNLLGSSSSDTIQRLFSPMASPLPAPTLLTPEVLLPGGSTTLHVPGGAGSILITGSKPATAWTILDTGTGSYTTNGIQQDPGSTNWSYDAPYSLLTGGAWTSFLFQALETNTVNISTFTTSLTISNYGFGIPSVTIDTATNEVSVPYATFDGTHNIDAIGHLTLTNLTTGGSQYIPISSPDGTLWSGTPFPLFDGPNTVRAYVTNALGAEVFAQFVIVANLTAPPLFDVTYVSPAGNHVFPYTNWLQAATNIQDAVDANAEYGTVLIADGHYMLTQEVTVNIPLDLLGLNDRESTIIDGQQLTRCMLFNTNDVWIESLTLQNGFTTNAGGGLFSHFGGYVIDCIFKHNKTELDGAAQSGGGIFIEQNDAFETYTFIEDSMIVSNTASAGNFSTRGGGIFIEELANPAGLFNCVIAYNNCLSTNGNTSGGGVFSSGNVQMDNCIVHHNMVESQGSKAKFNKSWGGGIHFNNQLGIAFGHVYNCTVADNTVTSVNSRGAGLYIAKSPFAAKNDLFWNNLLADGSLNNIRDNGLASVFETNFESGEDLYGIATNPAPFGMYYQPTTNLPVIDTGTDLEAEDVTEDIQYTTRGFDGDGDNIPGYDIGAWEIYNPLHDSDGDGSNDGHELGAGTDPFDGSSQFSIDALIQPGLTPTEWTIDWHSEPGIMYRITRSTNLMVGFDTTVISNEFAVPPLNVFTDNVPNAKGPYYYRIEME